MILLGQVQNMVQVLAQSLEGRRRSLCCAAVALLAVGCTAAVPPVAPTAYPLPSGALALQLPTQAPHPSGIGCPLVGPPGPVLMNWDRQTETLGFAFTRWGTTGDTVRWPAGFSARLYLNRAELIAPDGKVVARDGDSVPGVLGADPLSICAVDGTLY